VNHFDWSHRSQGNEETLLVVRSWKIENEWQLETLGADGVNKMNSYFPHHLVADTNVLDRPKALGRFAQTQMASLLLCFGS